jgi:CopG family transcriptional regulator, nickel-responsive regulator
MTIISMSINDKLLKDVDTLQEELGFSGRSEVIRAALRLLVADSKEKSELKGNVSAVLIVIHREEDNINKVKHDFSSVIKTQVHNHVDHKCLELFIIDGDAEKVKGLVNEFQKLKSTELVKLIRN